MDGLISIARWAVWDNQRLFYVIISVDNTGELYCRIELPILHHA